jgi:hypothetical protein
MAYWQASTTRAPAKTKAELREMLTEAVRNTRPDADLAPERPSQQAEAVADAASPAD